MSLPQDKPKSNPFPAPWAGALVLAVLAAAAYFPTLKAGFIWDDDTFLTQNRLIHAADGLRRFWATTQAPDYFPVTYTPLWAEWRLWGMHAAGFHAVNLALHIAGSLLLWAVLRRLRLPGAWLAACLFAVHPVNVESVAWITQRKNLMAMLFFPTSILAFVRYQEFLQEDQKKSARERTFLGGWSGSLAAAKRSDDGPRDADDDARATVRSQPRQFNHKERKGRKEIGTDGSSLRALRSLRLNWYFVSLLLFVLAMLSKGSVAMLPFVLLGIIAWRRRLEARDVLRVLPFFAVSAALVLVDVWFQKHGSPEVFRSAGFLERLLGAGAVVWFYLGKALAPVHLSFIYPQWHLRTGDPLDWIPLAAALALTLWLWSVRHGRARPFLFAWAYFCVSLVPVMGFVDVQFMQYSPVADHYEQLALIGPVALAAAYWQSWRSALPRLAPAAAAAAIAVLSVLTWRQCGLYRDAETLYRATLARNPQAWLAQSNLGSVLFRSGRATEAIGHFDAALRLKPDLFEAQNDLGLALAATGKAAEAMPHFEAAIRLHPDNAAVYYNAAGALSEMGRPAEAAPYYLQALRLRPEFAAGHQDYGAALAQMGRLSEAVAEFQEALRLRPDYFEAHANLGMVLAQTGRTEEAREQLQAALRLDPGNPQVRAALNRLP